MKWHLAAVGLEDEAMRMTDAEDFESQLWLGDPEVAISLAQARLKDDPDNVGVRLDMGRALACAGKYQEARPWLEKGWNLFVGINLDWGSSLFLGDVAQALIAALRDAGDEAAANRVLAEFRDYIRRYREAGITLTQWNTSVDYLEGVGAYLAGERDKGLALISKAAEAGYWLGAPAAYEQAMYNDPGFAPILERQKSRQAREREKILAVVCTNNPYATVWQPAEETCKRYFNAGRR
jgi:tetratricopeptide (TPR) repeat protein